RVHHHIVADQRPPARTRRSHLARCTDPGGPMTDTLATPRRAAAPRTTTRPKIDRRRVGFLAVGIVLAVGLALRLWIITGKLGTMDSDEALTGLMARHLWNGESRAAMWRFNYQSASITYPVALRPYPLATTRL